MVTKGKKIKPGDDMSIKTRAEADEALFALNTTVSNIEKVDIDYKIATEELKEKYKKQKAPFEADKKNLQNALGMFIMELLPEIKPAKSIKLNHGTIGARKSTKISIRGSEKEGYTLKKLKELNLRDFIITTEKVNKKALHDAPALTLNS